MTDFSSDGIDISWLDLELFFQFFFTQFSYLQTSKRFKKKESFVENPIVTKQSIHFRWACFRKYCEGKFFNYIGMERGSVRNFATLARKRNAPSLYSDKFRSKNKRTAPGTGTRTTLAGPGNLDFSDSYRHFCVTTHSRIPSGASGEAWGWMTNGRRRPTRNGLPPRIGRVTISRLSQIYFRPRNRVYVGRGSVIRGCALTILVPLRQRSVLPPRRQRGNNRLDTRSKMRLKRKATEFTSCKRIFASLAFPPLLFLVLFGAIENCRSEDYFCLSRWNQEEESALNRTNIIKNIAGSI